MLGANGVVAAGMPIAVGAAHALKIRGRPEIVCCFFGDGAVNRGPFLEALNWAVIYKLPVLFVCEDNGIGISVRTPGGWIGAQYSDRVGLEYFRAAGDPPDPRVDEAIDLLRTKRQADGTWLLENTHPGAVHFALEDGDGRPSRWNTLRALRVLRWYDQ
jgi:hypothetical protein